MSRHLEMYTSYSCIHNFIYATVKFEPRLKYWSHYSCSHWYSCSFLTTDTAATRQPHRGAQGEDMWHWLFDCLVDAILQEYLHSLQFNIVAQLCSRDFLLGLFAPQPHALSNAQSSVALKFYGLRSTRWPLSHRTADCNPHVQWNASCFAVLNVIDYHCFTKVTSNHTLVHISQFRYHISSELQSERPAVRSHVNAESPLMINTLESNTNINHTFSGAYLILHLWTLRWINSYYCPASILIQIYQIVPGSYLPWHRGFLLATAEPLIGRPLGVTHQQYPV